MKPETIDCDPMDLQALAAPVTLLDTGARKLVAPNRIVYQPMEGNDAEAIWEQLLEQKVQIDHFLMKDAAVHASGGVLEGKRLDVPPLTIELEGLGTGPEGDSVARVSAKVMRRISSRVSLAVTERMLTLGLGGKSARSERRRESDGEDETQEADSTPDDEAPRRGKHRRQ